jgi:hypothetical protein
MSASTTKRGYGHRHRERRKQVAISVEAGLASCARCGLAIEPGEPWDLGHDDFNRSRYTGPERRACNRATAGRTRKSWEFSIPADEGLLPVSQWSRDWHSPDQHVCGVCPCPMCAGRAPDA